MAARLRGETPRTDLTLSALPGLLPEDARTAAAIERQLDAISDAQRAGDRARADALTDDLAAHVVAADVERRGCCRACHRPIVLAHPGHAWGHVDPADWPHVPEPHPAHGEVITAPELTDASIWSESELRGAWGDR